MVRLTVQWRLGTLLGRQDRNCKPSRLVDFHQRRRNQSRDQNHGKAQDSPDQNDWIHYWYWVEKKTFQIRGGPLNLTEAVEIFVSWFNS
jgi:hypothetical protein